MVVARCPRDTHFRYNLIILHNADRNRLPWMEYNDVFAWHKKHFTNFCVCTTTHTHTYFRGHRRVEIRSKQSRSQSVSKMGQLHEHKRTKPPQQSTHEYGRRNANKTLSMNAGECQSTSSIHPHCEHIPACTGPSAIVLANHTNSSI